MEIRNCTYLGDIRGAIERINDLDPEILDTSPDLFFDVQGIFLISLRLDTGKMQTPKPHNLTTSPTSPTQPSY